MFHSLILSVFEIYAICATDFMCLVSYRLAVRLTATSRHFPSQGRLWDSLASLGTPQTTNDTGAPSPSPPAPAAAVPPAEPPTAVATATATATAVTAAESPPESHSELPDTLHSLRTDSDTATDSANDTATAAAGPSDQSTTESAMSSSYLQLFEDFAASARRSGSVSLARNLSCPAPEPEPEPVSILEPETRPEPESAPDRERGLSPGVFGSAERLCPERLTSDSVDVWSGTGGGDGSESDHLLSRSQQLLSAVERTLRVTTRRQRDPTPPLSAPAPAAAAASREASVRDTRPENGKIGAVTRESRDSAVTSVARVTDGAVVSSSGVRTGDVAGVSEESGSDRGVCSSVDTRGDVEQEPPRRRRPTLDENWWSRGGGEEEGKDQTPPQPQPEPQPEPSAAAGGSRPSDQQVRLWTAQLVTALDQLHQQGIVCR